MSTPEILLQHLETGDPIRGRRKVALAIGRRHQDIPRLVAEEGLRAFQVDGKGTWAILPEDAVDFRRRSVLAGVQSENRASL